MSGRGPTVRHRPAWPGWRRWPQLVPAVLLLLAGCSSPRRELAAPAPAGLDGSDGLVTANGGTRVAEPEFFERQRWLKALTDRTFAVQLGGSMIARKTVYAGEDDFPVPAYLFAPRDTTVRRPVVVMVHGGIHGDFDAGHIPQIRALVQQGFVIVAPEYRGSTGYGRAHYEAIDYGGKEVEDVIRARDWLAHAVPFADTSRIALLGWSHGGFIALHAVLRRPELFRAAVAHVPVADLPTRIRTHSEAYHRLFIDQPAFGARLEDDPVPYIERSPIAHARKLRVPVLVHAADNDQDVLIIENRNLRDSMVAAGKVQEGLYTYREFRDPPGGHSFSRMRTPQAWESWRETVAFLERYLKPPRGR